MTERPETVKLIVLTMLVAVAGMLSRGLYTKGDVLVSSNNAS